MFLVPLIHQMGNCSQLQHAIKLKIHWNLEKMVWCLTPPRIPLYYNMGVDKAGLHCYCTVWGANSVEGNIHMPLWRMFGSSHASPEFSDALLCNSCDRRNTTVSCKFYLSLMLISHSLSGWSFQSYGVVIMIHTGLINLWNLQLMWGFHHLFHPWNFVNFHCYKGIFGIIPLPEKIAEELGFERREEPAYGVNNKGNLLH